MAIKNQEALNERANNLKVQGLNGLKLVLVTLQPDPNPTEAILTLYFYNSNEVHNIFNDFDVGSELAKDIFPITGGLRIVGGQLADQIQVVNIVEDPINNTVLHLTVKPIGDYSTYSLSVVYKNIDPIFGEIEFKFRPGCFNICAPDWKSAPERKEDPAIDYLAKDYDSFRHTLITAMMQRVPDWQPTSEADLDQALIELFSVAADELSDYQDRVMNEAYLSTARERVSLAQHARLMDYHIHQGNQASSWLALKVKSEHSINKDFIVWAVGKKLDGQSSIVFKSRRRKDDDPHQVDPLYLHPWLNEISLYTWQDSIPALSAGTTKADLKLSVSGQRPAETVRDLIRDGKVKYLLIKEHKNPQTGETRGLDPNKRQLLRLISGADDKTKEPQAKQDPLTGEWFVNVHWEEKDKLKNNYCFTVDCPDGKVEDVALFHGNLVEVYHGSHIENVFKKEGTPLTGSNEFYYERTGETIDEATGGKKYRWGTICKLREGPLAYKDTIPGGEMPPETTLEVKVEMPGGGKGNWDEVISFIHSRNSNNHFIVETDEAERSLIRFGNGTNGKELPYDAIVRCNYQIGRGLDGNIGADKLINFNKSTFSEIESCWNPFDVTNGRAPEPVEEIIRRVPEAYRFRQLRAVTLKDYKKRAEELPDVSRAFASYAWTGSWRTVRIMIDPAGATALDDKLREEIIRQLDAVRLIGEDLEIRPPIFVPLEIHVSLCIHPDYWPEDIKSILEQEFSDGFTPDGRKAFFHPDQWTFGQELRASQIIGMVQSVKGVDHVTSVTMERWNAVTPGTEGVIEVQVNEIIQVKNNPDHMEQGIIFFDVKGGRQ
jgi:hypothetical protein